VIDEGPIGGTLPGLGHVHFTYDGNPKIAATFSIVGHGWSLVGHANGVLSSPNTNVPSFRGRLTFTGGTGRYAHASGTGELFGVFYRRSYALVVQAIATLRY
jgi:hypothetical protein